MPAIIIIAGPNGAGKTTFASEYLSDARERLEFVNADEIARGIAYRALPARQADTRAARVMPERIGDLVEAGVDFAFETTLATRTYARKIPQWQRRGYTVSLVYLRLPSAEASVSRVRRRVEAGGHDIPETVIRRRFGKGIDYLDKIYKPLVDEWYIWNSLEGAFVLAEAGRKMKRTLDVEKVEAALKRAALKAAHGTRAERAGRFLAKRAPRSERPSGDGTPSDLRRRKA